MVARIVIVLVAFLLLSGVGAATTIDDLVPCRGRACNIHEDPPTRAVLQDDGASEEAKRFLTETEEWLLAEERSHEESEDPLPVGDEPLDVPLTDVETLVPSETTAAAHPRVRPGGGLPSAPEASSGEALLQRGFPAFCRAWDDYVDLARLWVRWALHGAPDSPTCPNPFAPAPQAPGAGSQRTPPAVDLGSGSAPAWEAWIQTGSSRSGSQVWAASAAVALPATVAGLEAHKSSQAALVPGPNPTEVWLLLAFAALAVPILVLYRRVARRELFSNPTRLAIRERVAAEPGITAGGVARRLGIDYSTAQHHLRVLHEFSSIEARRFGGRVRYFASGQAVTEAHRGALVALRSEKAVRILATIATRPDASLGRIARETGLAKSTVDWHVGRMRKLGVLGPQGLIEPHAWSLVARPSIAP